MDVIDVDSEPFSPCENDKPEEVFSVDWRPASDMFWQLENRRSALLEYLSEYGPRDFPTFKKKLKKLKRTLTRLESSKETFDGPHCSDEAKLGKFRALFEDVAGHVNVATVRLNQPGLRKFFVEGIGRDVLPSLERRHSCSIEPVCETPSPIALTEGLESSSSSDLLLDSLFTPSEEKEETAWSGLLTLEDIEEVLKQEKTAEVVMEKLTPSVEECMRIKNTQIRITVGDLIQQTTDAVLILNNERLCLNTGGILNAKIARFAGSGLKEECKRIVNRSGAQLPGEAVITGSGNLPFKHLVHVINYPGSPQILDLQLGVKRGLQLADSKGLSSIALPAIGAGSMGLSFLDSAGVLSGGILSFLERPPQFLREIKIVLYMESMLWTYSQEIKTRFVPFVTLEEYAPLFTFVQGKDEFLPGVLRYSNSPLLLEDSFDKRNAKAPVATTEFRVYGKDRKNIMATINSLRTVYTKHCTAQRVSHRLVPQVTQYCWPLLSTVASRYDVDLIFEEHINSISVRGNSDDVSLVVGHIWEEITRLSEQQSDTEKRKLLAQYVRWHCIILDKEIAFNDKVSAIIEDARNRKCDEVKLFVNDCEYRVDFNSMTVLYSRSNSPPLPLCRRLNAEVGDSSPHFWAPQPRFADGAPVPVAMVNLLPGNPEYQRVASMFYGTGGNGSIVAIERVQNLPLYKQYTMYRQEVEKANCRSGLNNQNERQLFHGTNGCNVRSINLQGFNRSFCGRNGAAFGNGVYFAANASYSMGYTAPDSKKQRHMYLARVVVGFYKEGHKGLRVPPPLSPDFPEVLFDSVVDCVNNPRIFVVFKDSQCYPEYLITFT